MRANDEIGDDAFHQIEEELDWLKWQSAVRKIAPDLPSPSILAPVAEDDRAGWTQFPA